MVSSSLESHQDLCDVKATVGVFKCDAIWSKMHQKINPIDSILIKLGAEFLWGDIFESVGWEGKRWIWWRIINENPGGRDRLLPKTNFDGVDTQPLFDDGYFH